MVDVERLCELFADQLGLDTVAPETDFFLAGGHSLSALALAVAVERVWGLRVAIRDVVDHPTPQALAERLRHTAEPVRKLPPAAAAGIGNESRSLWLERQRGLAAATAYTVPCLFDVRGDLDVDRLAAAVAAVQRRYPVLRTVFAERDGEPHPVVRDEVSPLVVVDAGEDLDAAVYAEIEKPFDLEAGPLFRATLLRRPHGWSLLVVADHLVCDGTSLRVLAGAIAELYRDPARPEPGSSVPARDPDEVERSLAYWRRVLAPLPEPLALPVNRPRRGPVGDTGIVVAEVPADVLTRLRDLARSVRSGVFVPLAAAVVQTLSELTGATDVCLGTAVDRRARYGALDAVGFHVVTVPLRVAVGEKPRDLVAAVAGATVDAVDHSAASFDEIVAAVEPPRRRWRTPLFDVFAAVYPLVDTGEVGEGIRLTGGPVPLRQGIVELSFQFVEHPGGLRLHLQHDRSRYDRETASRMADRVIAAATRIAEPTSAPPPRDRTAVFGGFRFST